MLLAESELQMVFLIGSGELGSVGQPACEVDGDCVTFSCLVHGYAPSLRCAIESGGRGAGWEVRRRRSAG